MTTLVKRELIETTFLKQFPRSIDVAIKPDRMPRMAYKEKAGCIATGTMLKVPVSKIFTHSTSIAAARREILVRGTREKSASQAI